MPQPEQLPVILVSMNVPFNKPLHKMNIQDQIVLHFLIFSHVYENIHVWSRQVDEGFQTQTVGIYVHRGKLYCMNNSLTNRVKSLVLCHCSCYLASLSTLFATGHHHCGITDGVKARMSSMVW